MPAAVHKDLFVCLCIPHVHVAQGCPLPSLDTTRHQAETPSIVAFCFPSSTRHTPAPPFPLLKMDSPSAENVTTDPAPTSISIGSSHSCLRSVSMCAPSRYYAPIIVDDVVISYTM
ncbi:hypothetical protein HD554DRAFT_1451958 [Boletus coccyginus]|nr:hypothetical protein HD554DRAFT_1451958 [Boletus coccyginus]